MRFVQGHIRRRQRVRAAQADHRRRSTRNAARWATTRSTCRSHRTPSPVVTEQLRRSGLAEQRERPVAPSGDREAVRARPRTPHAQLQRRGRVGVPARQRVPHRPLPGQGDGPEHPGAAVRRTMLYEPIWNANYVDHIQITDGRGHRRRRPGGLLRRHRRGPRRHPEPPAAAARADRHGGAGRRSTPPTSGPRRSRCSRRCGCPRSSASAPPAVSTRAAGRAARRSSASSRRTG